MQVKFVDQHQSAHLRQEVSLDRPVVTLVEIQVALLLARKFARARRPISGLVLTRRPIDPTTTDSSIQESWNNMAVAKRSVLDGATMKELPC